MVPPTTSIAAARAFTTRLPQVLGCACGSPVEPEVNAMATTRAAGNCQLAGTTWRWLGRLPDQPRDAGVAERVVVRIFAPQSRDDVVRLRPAATA